MTMTSVLIGGLIGLILAPFVTPLIIHAIDKVADRKRARKFKAFMRSQGIKEDPNEERTVFTDLSNPSVEERITVYADNEIIYDGIIRS